MHLARLLLLHLGNISRRLFHYLACLDLAIISRNAHLLLGLLHLAAWLLLNLATLMLLEGLWIGVSVGLLVRVPVGVPHRCLMLLLITRMTCDLLLLHHLLLLLGKPLAHQSLLLLSHWMLLLLLHGLLLLRVGNPVLHDGHRHPLLGVVALLLLLLHIPLLLLLHLYLTTRTHLPVGYHGLTTWNLLTSWDRLSVRDTLSDLLHWHTALLLVHGIARVPAHWPTLLLLWVAIASLLLVSRVVLPHWVPLLVNQLLLVELLLVRHVLRPRLPEVAPGVAWRHLLLLALHWLLLICHALLLLRICMLLHLPLWIPHPLGSFWRVPGQCIGRVSRWHLDCTWRLVLVVHHAAGTLLLLLISVLLLHVATSGDHLVSTRRHHLVPARRHHLALVGSTGHHGSTSMVVLLLLVAIALGVPTLRRGPQLGLLLVLLVGVTSIVLHVQCRSPMYSSLRTILLASQDHRAATNNTHSR